MYQTGECRRMQESKRPQTRELGECGLRVDLPSDPRLSGEFEAAL